ncbi:MAG: 3-deoxy-7-phosphoheptulonate synthase [Pseudomonadota bacterium]
MKETQDLRVKGYRPLMTPAALKEKMPRPPEASETVITGRKQIEQVLRGQDRRLIVVVGPCSIHDPVAALDYARRLDRLRREVAQTIIVVMRVYFEKPRTTIGWKGLINDPRLDGSCDMEEGLKNARGLLLDIVGMGLPTATEMLDPITPQYVADLVSWSAIGARTTESQTHREMASGLSMPVGFKNGTDGNLKSPINAILASRAPQGFLGIDQQGRTSIVQTSGNPFGHLVVRGGARPNYDAISIESARMSLIEKGLPELIMVDCSHANSMKKHQGQAIVWRNVLEQRVHGDETIIGMMLESNLFEGNQKFTGDMKQLKYGVSITDECISWESTETLLREAHEKLSPCLGLAGGQRKISA